MPQISPYPKQCNADACRQGRARCPFPVACQVAEADDDLCLVRDLAWACAAVLALALVAMLGAFLI